MKLNQHLISKIAQCRSPKAAIPSPCLDSAENDQRIPGALLETLATYNFNRALSGKGFDITVPEQLKYIETFGLDFLSENLLPIGSTCPGDLIVVDLVSGVVGFGSHDKLGVVTLRDAFVEVAESLGCFCEKAATVEDFPGDYWEAVERVGN